MQTPSPQRGATAKSGGDSRVARSSLPLPPTPPASSTRAGWLGTSSGQERAEDADATNNNHERTIPRVRRKRNPPLPPMAQTGKSTRRRCGARTQWRRRRATVVCIRDLAPPVSSRSSTASASASTASSARASSSCRPRCSDGRAAHSPLAWLVVGSLCTLIALCFAEAASRTDRSGGPYRYAVEAFGPLVGFAVGWITMISSLLGYAGVARGFAVHAAFLVGGGDSRPALIAGVVVRGRRCLGGRQRRRHQAVGARRRRHQRHQGARPRRLRRRRPVLRQGANLHAAPAPATGESPGLFAAAFAGLFACTGFEYVPVPAGETVNPQRAIGLAMVVSVIGATLLYVLVQIVAMGTLPTLATSDAPIVDAARAFAGPVGANVIAVVASLSALGFCAGSAMVVPRYVETFAQDAFLPRMPRAPLAALRHAGGRHRRRLGAGDRARRHASTSTSSPTSATSPSSCSTSRPASPSWCGASRDPGKLGASACRSARRFRSSPSPARCCSCSTSREWSCSSARSCSSLGSRSAC